MQSTHLGYAYWITLSLFACSSTSVSNTVPSGSGGTVAVGSTRTGGSTGSNTGGTSSSATTSTGGAAIAGGTAATGGKPSSTGGGSTGGKSSSTGGSSAGGKPQTGGTNSIGGTQPTGGTKSTGGMSNGGTSASTGGANTGGTKNATGGATSAGGSSAAGGTSANGGGTATGGTSSVGSGGTNTAGSSSTTPGMCASAFFSADAAGRKESEYKSWKSTYVQECTSNNSAVVKNGGGVYSEGIGYGMLLAANNDDQDLFKKLWKFYTDHLDPNGLMNWSMDACAAPGNNNANAASDGDLDAAMGLVLADKKWGGYTNDAKGLIGKIKQFETDSCPNGLVVLRPGDKFGGCSDSGSMGKVNPSYFSPGYYRVFATVDTENATFWTKLATDSYTLLAQYQATMSGLVPEWGYYDGRAESNTYDYNACRTPWRVAVDYMWFCTPEAKTFLTKVSTFIDGKGGVTKTGYAQNSAFIGAFADSGIAISQSKIDSYESDWMGNTQMDDTPYFQGTLRRLYLLVAGGQFACN